MRTCEHGTPIDSPLGCDNCSVSHPPHYRQGGVETIEGIKAALGDGFVPYCKGNALKYIWRADHKGKPVQDLKKANWYLTQAIAELEAK